MVDLQAEANSSSSHLHADPTSVRIDFASPLYLHPSESAGSSLLPAVFDGTGYRSWRRAVLRALSVKSKTGFINGTLVRPAPTDPGFLQWERCDDMVTSWILNSLSPDLRDSLQYVNNAHELWAELEERYDQTNGCKLYQLQKEINDLVQGPLDITGYYTRMKKLWEGISTIDVNSQCTCVCTCGGKTKLHKAEQDRRLIHFLMGLNEMYTSIRGNILMMSTLPSMARAFAILSQEEKQRKVKPNNHTVLDSTSLNAYGQSSNSAARKDFKTNYSSTRGGGNNYGNFNNNNVFRGSSSTTRSSLFCEYCKRSGHTKDRCYKLHGYPPNSRFPKGKGSGSAGNVCAAEMNEHGHQNEEDPVLKKQMPLNLSKDQYEQLLNLLGTLKIGNGNSNFDNSDNMMSGAVNLAGAAEITKLALWGNYTIPKDNPYIEDKELQPEIWALGMRNPWRCSFDSARPSYFMCADVGQDHYEEVDLITKGGNYGWRMYEGDRLFTPSKNTSINPIFPVMGYNHSDINKVEGSASITGGYFYRSTTDPCMSGKYLYADLYAGAMWAGTETPEDSGTFNTTEIPFTCAGNSPINCALVPGSTVPALGYIFSYGEDNNKDVYLLASSGVYRVVRPSRCKYTCSKENATDIATPAAPGTSPPSAAVMFTGSYKNLVLLLLSFWLMVIS